MTVAGTESLLVLPLGFPYSSRKGKGLEEISDTGSWDSPHPAAEKISAFPNVTGWKTPIWERRASLQWSLYKVTLQPASPSWPSRALGLRGHSATVAWAPVFPLHRSLISVVSHLSLFLSLIGNKRNQDCLLLSLWLCVCINYPWAAFFL